jgi:hypothetical protein
MVREGDRKEPLRVVVLGVTGSGKTTAARRIATAIGRRDGGTDVAHVELDALYWEPNWTEAEPDVFRERIRAAIEGRDRWVADGNYRSLVWDVLWVRADTIVWLDYPLWRTQWRLFLRSARRVFTREELWSGNRESFRGQFLSGESLFMWARTSQPKYRRAFPAAFALPEMSHVDVRRFASPAEFETWMRGLNAETQRAKTA